MIQMERSDWRLMMEAGYIYLGMQRFKEAKEVFDGLNVLAPDSEIPLVALGNVEFCQGRFPAAIKHYHEALKRNSESLFAKAYLGEALFFSEKKNEAFQLLEEVARSDRSGGTGDFARALLDAAKNGFTPEVLSGLPELKKHHERPQRVKA